MRTEITPDKCLVTIQNSTFLSTDEYSKIRFMIGAKFRKSTRGRFLGFTWLLLDPLIISLIYFFLFSVVRSNPNAASILVGVTLYRIFQTSVLNGINALGDLNGGLKSERVRTRVVLTSELIYRIIDSTMQSILIVAVIIVAFDSTLLGGLSMLLIAQFSSILFFGLGASIAPIVNRIPDLKNIISYVLRIGFYASPAMYPMSLMVGLHYEINKFNPFAYVAETVREIMGLESTYNQLDPTLFYIHLIVLFFLTIIGIKRADELRWRMTTWS